jgi:hypothetical protein
MAVTRRHNSTLGRSRVLRTRTIVGVAVPPVSFQKSQRGRTGRSRATTKQNGMNIEIESGRM